MSFSSRMTHLFIRVPGWKSPGAGLAFVLLSIMACWRDSPVVAVGSPLPAFVNGSWEFNAWDLVGGDVTCDMPRPRAADENAPPPPDGVPSMRLRLEQDGNNFSGTYGRTREGGPPGGRFTCLLGSDTILNDLDFRGPVVNGEVATLSPFETWASLSFDLDTPDFHFTGSICGDSMAGRAALRVDLGGDVGVVELAGPWLATGAGRGVDSCF